MSDNLTAILLSLAAIIGATLFHYEALRLIGIVAELRHRPRFAVPTLVTLVTAAHLAEIVIYAGIYGLAAGPLAIGHFSGEQPHALGLIYFAAETYSSLGASETFPHGALRLIVSVGSLNGLLLLAWSGSFLLPATNVALRASTDAPSGSVGQPDDNLEAGISGGENHLPTMKPRHRGRQ